MVRKGREFENLITILERDANKLGMTIKAPDFIEDKITGKKREIDISIRGMVDSKDYLVILECRDWKRPQDVLWIEQLAGKRDGVGADKAIAISSTRFTSSAVKKAKALNIELRSLRDINIDNIKGWFQVVSLENQQFCCSILEIRPIFRNPKKDQNRVARFFNGEISTSERIIFHSESEDPLSLNQLVQMVNNTNRQEIFQGIVPDSGKSQRTLELFPKIRKNGFQLLMGDERITVNYFEFLLQIEIKNMKKSNITAVKSYENAHIIRFEESPLLNNSLDLICSREGEGHKIRIKTSDNISESTRKVFKTINRVVFVR